LGQGFAYGVRPLASGGIGLLVDGEGHDRYLAEVFAQGGAYWCGLGGLVDRGGNDHYDGFNYVQGAGVHVAVAALSDGGGDDVYRAKGVSQGCGHDLAFGMLVDAAGDDHYDASDLSQGAGNANGLGLFVDLAGSDAVSVRNPSTSQGYGNWRRNYGSVGVLLNVGGIDRYLGGSAGEDKLWQVGEHGVGVDSDSLAIAALGRSQPRDATDGEMREVDQTRLPPPAPPALEPLEPLEPKPAIAPPESIPQSVRALDFQRLFDRAAAGEPRFTRERDQARGEIVRRGQAAVPELVARLGTRVARERHAIKDLALLLGRKRVEKPFARVMAGTDERAARAAAWCLERIEAQGVEKELAAAAKHPSWRVRSAALMALARCGDQTSTPVLIAALEDPVGPVRQAAAHALGERAVRARRRGNAELSPALASALPPLAELLNDSFYGARHNAARALGRAGPSATPILLEVVSAREAFPPARYRRSLAVQALGEGRDPRAISILSDLSGATDPLLRAQAVVALARLGGPPAADSASSSGFRSPIERAAELVMAEAEERARALGARRESAAP
jgi:HEAT repeat protein